MQNGSSPAHGEPNPGAPARDGNPAEALERELTFYAALQRELGEQRIDIVVHRRGSALRPIDREALRTGVVL
jgi:hypothetical protein